MKLNLPSTITNQKALIFYFWTLVNLGKSKSGVTFENCLDNQYSVGNYIDLVNEIANNNSSPDNGTFCCYYDNINRITTCSPLIAGQNIDFTNYCPNSLSSTIYFGRCTKIDQSYFCVIYIPNFFSQTGWDLGNQVLCGGRLDNNPITISINNITPNKCDGLNFGNLTEFLTGITSNFTAVCCNNFNLINDGNCVLGDLGLAKYGHVLSTTTNCFNDYTLMCFQDNGGWTCTGGEVTNQINLYPLGYIANGTYPNTDNLTNFPTSFSGITYIGDCNVQIKLPVSSSSNTIISSTNSLTSPSILPQNNSSNSNPNLTIIIPTTVGTVWIISSGGMTYYLLIRKKKKKQQNLSELTHKQNQKGMELILVEKTNESRKENLTKELEIRKREMSKLIDQAKNKLGEGLHFLLENLLETQVEIAKFGNDSLLKGLLQNSKDSLSKKISREEIEIICQKQKEIIQLEEINESLQVSQREEDLIDVIQIQEEFNDTLRSNESFKAYIEIPLK